MSAFLWLLVGWLALGVVFDAVLYGLQRSHLNGARGDAPARIEGEQRARQRLVHHAQGAALALLAIVFVWASGLLSGTAGLAQAALYLALAIAADRVLRALLSESAGQRGRLPAIADQFKALARPLGLGVVLWAIAAVVSGALIAGLWAASWLLLAALWRAYRVWGQMTDVVGSRLTDPVLRTRLQGLAEACGRPRCAITVADQPPLAAQVGARVEARGRGGQIVLTRALVDRLPPPRIQAVVAHEFGHACLGHLLRFDVMRAVLVAVYIIVLAGGLFAVYPQASAPIVLWLVYVTLGPAAWAARPVLNAYRRHCEFAADAFGARHVGPALLADTLADLFSVNPHRAGLHPWYRAFMATHPADGERLDRLRRF